jgi:hypothetical protein
LAEWVALLLEPDERDAVRGDLAESGESGLQALAGLLGLVARPQAALWKDRRPWPALVGLAPLGLLLTRRSAQVTRLSAIYLWMYVDTGRAADLGSAGYWRLMAQVGAPFLLSSLLLMVWSCAGGMAIGVRARRTAAVNGVLFCGALALADIAAAQRGGVAANDPVFALTFYRAIYRLPVHPVLIMLPALWGMVLGARVGVVQQGWIAWFNRA